MYSGSAVFTSNVLIENLFLKTCKLQKGIGFGDGHSLRDGKGIGSYSGEGFVYFAPHYDKYIGYGLRNGDGDGSSHGDGSSESG